ncbi:hypothetical protein PR202_gb29935 [Eleusine coracana subsp. coracana]|uniref:Protein kinase domain-containing protein n=1 Tax=Eleusine coracana subsp. coracana TaxID=191504 RepID=A0AAV5G071_ELECO|nr:hypothetical protein PR202_gb29935 [Eleusine coracana subsp. coracana]
MSELGISYIDQNFLHGSIPSAMNKLTGLQELDLSCNNLSGAIPEFLGSFAGLTYLNLSFNNLTGEVPEAGIFLNASAFSIAGNNGLCGGIPMLNLPPCPTQQSRKKHKFPKLAIILSVLIPVFCLIAFICLLVLWYWRHRSNEERSDPTSPRNQLPRVSYMDLSRATNGFSTANLIGEGRFGSVYMGNMNSGEHRVVAVKILKLQERGASHSFLAECETLRYLRHRNLVKILTVCSTFDPRGHDFKSLVFEFLPNGSLDKWLRVNIDEHGVQQALNLCQRLGIVIDVGSAVEYLHGFKPKPVVHCDLKPSNILLDSDLVAHVGDFGLARFINQQDRNSFQSSGWDSFRGTLGYAAPGYPDHVEGVVEQNLIQPIEDIEGGQNRILNKEVMLSCITSILRVGLLCSKQLPEERMQISEAAGERVRLACLLASPPLLNCTLERWLVPFIYSCGFLDAWTEQWRSPSYLAIPS